MSGFFDAKFWLESDWLKGKYSINIKHHYSVPVRELNRFGLGEEFTIIIGTEIDDQSGISSGSWVLIRADPGSGILTVKRDPAGLMACFVAKVPKGYLVSDSIPLLLQHPHVSREIDPSAFNEYWFLDYCIPPKTIWGAIKAIPNGYSADFELGDYKEPRFKQYYFPGVEKDKMQFFKESTPKKLRKIILDITSQSLLALDGRPFVNFLSGGIDSSVVFAACNMLGSKPDFAITFKGDGDADESALATLTAKRFSVPLEVISSDGTDIIADAYEIVRIWGQPYSHGSVTAMQAMLAHLPDGYAVFTGDGGGEAFKWQAVVNSMMPLRILGACFGRFFDSLSVNNQRALYKKIAGRSRYGRGLFWWLEFVSSRDEQDLTLNSCPINSIESKSCFKDIGLNNILKYAIKKELVRLAELSVFNNDSSFARALLFSYAPECVYAKTWRILDRKGLTGFAPLTAPTLLEAVKRIPPGVRGLDKTALRDAFADMLPPELLNAPKRGLMPINRRLLREAAKDGIPWLSSPAGNIWDQLFAGEALARMWRAHAEGKVYRSTLLYKAIVFRCWAELWKPELPKI